MYMVIHDLKHPNEALIENVDRVMQQLFFTQTQLAQALCENNELKKQINQFMNAGSESEPSLNLKPKVPP